MDKRNQYEPFFSEGSPYLRHPLLTPERTSEEIDFVIAEMGVGIGTKILDIGCGPGRHSIELERRGYHVVGIDPSSTMIAAASRQAEQAGVKPTFLVDSGESFTTQEYFHGAICLFTTLGQISAGQDNRKLIQRTYDALVPGGHFIVEVPHLPWVKANLIPSERYGSESNFTLINRKIGDCNDVTEEFQVTSMGESKFFRLKYQLFHPDQLMDLFQSAGFSCRFYDSYSKVPLKNTSKTIVAVARK